MQPSQFASSTMKLGFPARPHITWSLGICCDIEDSRAIQAPRRGRSNMYMFECAYYSRAPQPRRGHIAESRCIDRTNGRKCLWRGHSVNHYRPLIPHPRPSSAIHPFQIAEQEYTLSDVNHSANSLSTTATGDPREDKGYTAILPRFGAFLIFSPCWAVETPEKAKSSCVDLGHF